MVQQAPAPVKKSNTGRNVILIVVILLLICCCVVIVGGGGYYCGDMLTGKGPCGF